jgi:hypothetical protein
VVSHVVKLSQLKCRAEYLNAMQALQNQEHHMTYSMDKFSARGSENFWQQRGGASSFEVVHILTDLQHSCPCFIDHNNKVTVLILEDPSYYYCNFELGLIQPDGNKSASGDKLAVAKQSVLTCEFGYLPPPPQ